jgi:hypothetical protein
MGARNRVGIGLSYRPARLHTYRLAKLIPGLPKSLEIRTLSLSSQAESKDNSPKLSHDRLTTSRILHRKRRRFSHFVVDYTFLLKGHRKRFFTSAVHSLVDTLEEAGNPAI